MLKNADFIRNQFDILHRSIGQKYSIDPHVVSFIRKCIYSSNHTRESLKTVLLRKMDQQRNQIRYLLHAQEKKSSWGIKSHIYAMHSEGTSRRLAFYEDVVKVLEDLPGNIWLEVIKPSEISKMRNI